MFQKLLTHIFWGNKHITTLYYCKKGKKRKSLMHSYCFCRSSWGLAVQSYQRLCQCVCVAQLCQCVCVCAQLVRWQGVQPLHRRGILIILNLWVKGTRKSHWNANCVWVISFCQLQRTLLQIWSTWKLSTAPQRWWQGQLRRRMMPMLSLRGKLMSM